MSINSQLTAGEVKHVKDALKASNLTSLLGQNRNKQHDAEKLREALISKALNSNRKEIASLLSSDKVEFIVC